MERDSMITIKELENRVILSIRSTSIQGCYQCINFSKAKIGSSLHAIITFNDKSSVKLCLYHFVLFNQRMK